jgi:hypothetical protein
MTVLKRYLHVSVTHESKNATSCTTSSGVPWCIGTCFIRGLFLPRRKTSAAEWAH